MSKENVEMCGHPSEADVRVRAATVRGRAATTTRRMLASLGVAAMGLWLGTSPAMARTHATKSPSLGGLYVATGDSLTAGTGATPGHGFVDLLFTQYRSTIGVTELSTRTGFAMTSAVLRTGGELDKALADIDGTSDTRVVTITIGGNDVGFACNFDFTSSACPFRTNFSATLTDLRRALANDAGEEPLIALAYYNPSVGEPTEAMWDRALLGTPTKLGCADTGAELGLNDIVAQQAASDGARVANAYPPFKATGDAYLTPGNDAHPNDTGYAALAEIFRNPESPCRPALTLDAKKQELKKKLALSATVDSHSKLIATGRAIKKTTEELAANEKTKVKAKLKRKAHQKLAKDIGRKGTAKTKIRATATTEAGGTATDKIKVAVRD
jgi:lysophospholipase L1-like esterase